MITWMKTVVGTVAFVVPVTISFMDKIGMIVKVEGASMQPVLNPDLQARYADYVFLNMWSARSHQFQRGEIVTFITDTFRHILVLTQRGARAISTVNLKTSTKDWYDFPLEGQLTTDWGRLFQSKLACMNHENKETLFLMISPRNPDQAFIKRIIGLEGDFVRTIKDDMVKIPSGHCWVEGENHRNSMDSNAFGACLQEIPTLWATVQWESRQASFYTGTVGPRISLSLIKGKASHIVWPPRRWQKLEAKEVDTNRLLPCHRDSDFR